jgi:3-phosphoshikimate 1-carboxyvinyltransferase
MQKSIGPSTVDGILAAPASKSYMQRALAAALLARGTTTIANPSFSEDSMAAMSVIQNLGARVVSHSEQISVHGGFNPQSSTLHCGEAGLSIRMFSPIAALHDKSVQLTGEGSLLKRPQNLVVDTLIEFGVSCETNNGFLPVFIKGPLMGGHAHVDGSVSSQFLTGLLLALPRAQNDSVLAVTDLTSKPYIDMTIDVLNSFGICIEHESYQQFIIAGNQAYQPCHYTVEGDWSGAAFLLVAGAIAGNVAVQTMRYDSKQADRAVMQALEQAGAYISVEGDVVTVKKPAHGSLKGFTFDATECPDLFPPLAALACHCSGQTAIKGVSRLTYKESDRAQAIVQEFGKIGGHISVEGDWMYIDGSNLHGGEAFSHNDHRIAMALATAALAASGEVVITQADCVAKSYPEFYDDIEKIGGKIDE